MQHPLLNTISLKSSLPDRRSKEPARSAGIRIRHPNRRIQVIHVIIRHADPPPRRHGRIRKIDRQDNDNGADRQSGIQSRRSDVIKAHPPAPVLVPDVLVENVPHNAPREVVERRSGWDLATAAEDEGSGEIAERSAGEGASEGVEEDGGQCAGKPEVLEVGVDGSGGEDALWTDETPDDGSVEKDAAVGTVELVGLVLGTNICYGSTKSPLED